MKRLRMVAMVFAAALALALVGSASASAAEPAFYECAKAEKVEGKYTGKFLDKKCSEEATAEEIEKGKTNKYELQEGIRKGKTYKGSGAGGNYNIKGLGGWDCASSSDTGKLTSPTSAGDAVITFKGCEFNGKKLESGETAGEIVTNPLKWGLGYLEGKGTKTPRVGIDISAESGEVLMIAHMGALTFAVTGAVIGEIEPVNTFTKDDTLTFKQSSKLGVQEWAHFEGGPEDTLLAHVCETEGCNPFKEGFTAEMAWETTITDKGEELMLKA
jgi:hypothetical protein